MKRIHNGDFKKGHIPWNKGLKGIHLSPNSEFKKGEHYSPKTEFKKGLKPWNAGVKGTHFSPNTEFKKGMFIEEENHKWLGDKVGYSALHTWVVRRLGNPKKCVKCGTTDSKAFHWHNIDGEYRRELSDWERLCAKCHKFVHKDWRVKCVVC